MRKNRALTVVIGFAAILAGILTGCATINSGKSLPSSEAAPALSSQADYLGEGTVLAAMMWQDGAWSEVTDYPARIFTRASAETKNEYEIESVRGGLGCCRRRENLDGRRHLGIPPGTSVRAI